MTDITNPRLLYLKGGLFLFGGILSVTLILLAHPSLRVAFLLTAAIWFFARAYYFAFYVIEHYIDSTYHYAGLWSFLTYLRHQKKSSSREK